MQPTHEVLQPLHLGKELICLRKTCFWKKSLHLCLKTSSEPLLDAEVSQDTEDKLEPLCVISCGIFCPQLLNPVPIPCIISYDHLNSRDKKKKKEAAGLTLRG